MKGLTDKVRGSFAWLGLRRHWLALLALTVWSVGLGIWAYQPPLNYQLNIGGNDAPFVRNANTRRLTRIDQGRSMRWLRGNSSVYLPGISVSYPITLSLYTGGGGRRDVDAGRAVTLTLAVNGYPLTPIRLTDSNRWYSWRIEPAMLASGRLDLSERVPGQISTLVVWPEGVIAEWLKVEPAVPTATIAPLSDRDWGEVVLLAIIVLLTYSFFPLGGRRWQWFGLLFCFALAVALALLLLYNRPLFAFDAPIVALALLLIRLALPLIRTGGEPRHTLRWLFILTLTFGLLMAIPDFQSGDDGLKYLTAEAMLTRGTLKLPPAQKDLGTPYSRYLPGHAVAELPLLALALGVQQLNGAPDGIRYIFVMLLDPIVTALGVALFFLCARRLFGSRRLALALSLIYYFATFTLAYAVQSWSEPLLATLVLLAFYAMLRVFDAGEPRPVRWLMVAGLALGYALFTKEEFALVAASFGLWWLARRAVELRNSSVGWAATALRLAREGLFLALPMLCFYSLNLDYNYIRNGDFFATSYAAGGILSFDTPLLTGLYGLLLSPGKGLVWLAPPALLTLWAVRGFWLRYRWELALIGMLFVPMLVFYSVYSFWEGGTSWGPRYLLPYLPLLMLVSGAALAGWRGWRRWQQGGYIALTVLGVFVALAGMLVNPSDAWLYGRDQVGAPWDVQVEFSVQHSLILNAFGLVAHGYTQPQTVMQLSYYHFPYFSDQLVPGLLVAVMAVAMMKLETATGN